MAGRSQQHGIAAATANGSAFTAAPGMGNLRATNAADAEGSRRLSAAPVEHGQSADQATVWTQATPLLALGAVVSASTMGIGARTMNLATAAHFAVSGCSG